METPIIYWWNMPPAAQASLDPAFTFMIDDSEERPTAQELYDNIICCDCVLIVTGESWIPAELAFIAGMAMGVLFVLLNLGVDLLYTLIDPRITLDN